MNADDQLSHAEPAKAIERGILLRLKGIEPSSGAPTIRGQYMLIDAILVLLSLGLLWSLARLPLWRSRPPAIRALVRVTVELLLPLGVFALTPVLFDAPWSVILLGVPDLGRWALAAAIVLFATGVIRGALIVRGSRRTRAATARSVLGDVNALAVR